MLLPAVRKRAEIRLVPYQHHAPVCFLLGEESHDLALTPVRTERLQHTTGLMLEHETVPPQTL